MGYGRDDDPRVARRGVDAQPPHREILLSPVFREAGVGIAAGVPGGSARGFTYVAAFGRRRC